MALKIFSRNLAVAFLYNKTHTTHHETSHAKAIIAVIISRSQGQFINELTRKLPSIATYRKITNDTTLLRLLQIITVINFNNMPVTGAQSRLNAPCY